MISPSWDCGHRGERGWAPVGQGWPPDAPLSPLHYLWLRSECHMGFDGCISHLENDTSQPIFSRTGFMFYTYNKQLGLMHEGTEKCTRTNTVMST